MNKKRLLNFSFKYFSRQKCGLLKFWNYYL